MNPDGTERAGSVDAGGMPSFVAAPQGERHVLDAASLRRRQLCAAFLHGSRRSWRRRHRAWPAAAVGLLVVAVIVAAFSVASAFHKQQEINQEKRTGLGIGTAPFVRSAFDTTDVPTAVPLGSS